MRDDFDLIVCKYPDSKLINLYPIGDVHIGAKEHDEKLFRAWVDTVANDPDGYALIVGDMMNMGLRNSKTNIYEEALTPREQKEVCYQSLLPIKEKIIAGVSGNHEYRQNKEVGTNPLYDVFCRLGIEDRYRENAAFLKLNVGNWRANHPNTYGVVLTHGATKSKDLAWTYAVDGADIFVSGHTHLGTHQPCAKIRMDLTHEVVKTVNYEHIVVVPFQQYGGYAMRGKYLPNSVGKYQKITLAGDCKRIGYSFI